MANIVLKDKNGADVICENVKSVNFRTVDGGSVSFGEKQEFNIAYGDTAPEDTSKLWIKTSKPNGVTISTNVNTATIGSSGYRKLDVTFSHPAYNMATAVIDDSVYLMGGATEGATYCSTIYRFDTKTETLTTLETVLPHALNGATSHVVGHKIYLFDGYKHDKTICCYDVDTQLITTLSCQFSQKVTNGVSVTIGTKAYIFGKYSPHLQIFDSETEEITTSNITFPDNCDSWGGLIGDLVYLFRYNYSNNKNTTLYVYDTKSDTVNKTKDFGNIGITQPAVAVIDGLMYWFGGTGGNAGSISNVIRCFDPSTLEITTLPQTLSFKGYQTGVGVIGNDVYLFGAYGYGSSNSSNHIGVYTVSGKGVAVDNGKLFIYPSLDSNRFPLINTEAVKVEIGVSAIYKGNADNIGEYVEAALYKDGEWTTI